MNVIRLRRIAKILHFEFIMDSIADMFTRIINAYRAGKEAVIIPHSNSKSAIMRVLKERDFIADISKKGKKTRKFLEVVLRYENKIPAMAGFVRVSKPSRRLYASKGEIEKIRRGYGMLILSTSKGVMSGEEAKKAGLGGEVIAKVW